MAENIRNLLGRHGQEVLVSEETVCAKKGMKTRHFHLFEDSEQHFAFGRQGTCRREGNVFG